MINPEIRLIVNPCLFSRQVWSVFPMRSIWSLRYLNTWPAGTTTAAPMVITRMWSTSAQQSTSFMDDSATQPVPLHLRIPTSPISIGPRDTTTTNTESCSGNTSAGAASNVCKGTLYSSHCQLSNRFVSLWMQGLPGLRNL